MEFELTVFFLIENNNNLAKTVLKKFKLSANFELTVFELTVFELTVPNLYTTYQQNSKASVYFQSAHPDKQGTGLWTERAWTAALDSTKTRVETKHVMPAPTLITRLKPTEAEM